MSDDRDVDRQLLFGILALQNNFIDRPTLVSALRSWVLDRSGSLARVLEDRGAIDGSARPLLDALVAHQVKLNGDDPRRSLAALGSTADPDPAGTLLRLASSDPTDPDDPYATRVAHPESPTLDPTELAPAASRFRVLGPHAVGGLGRVSLALDVELGRQVALKELHDNHADHPEYRSRFVREAEITGKLEHPGIIPVYGLGQYQDGRPYYAMRFIRGESLGEAIARHHSPASTATPTGRSLRLRELLGHFLDVCDAVAYAHGRRVIHRDLKPANILLGPFGETLVADWGLAKPLDDPEEATSTLGPLRPSLDGGDSTPTIAGVAHGTPAYMSPEQAEGRLDLLGPASDVYSLGATLYHLLAGRPPFGGPDAVRKVAAGDFPPPRKVLESVPRALEAICLKAMALQPGDRYPGPEAMAADLKLWLADEPVSAHREGLAPRARRWMKRHRTAVAAAATVALAAIVALGSIGVLLAGKNQELLMANRGEKQARAVADLARDRAEAARASAEAESLARVAALEAARKAELAAQQATRRAEVEARTAGRTNDFLVEIFTDSDPLAIFTGGRGAPDRDRGSRTAVEILEAGARKVVDGLKDEPLVQASLMDAIGNALRSKARLDQAEPLIRKALDLRRAHLPAGDPKIADSLEALGWLNQDQGKTGEALDRFNEALAIRIAATGEDHPDVARTLTHVAWALAEEGRMGEAEPMFRRAIKIREAHPGSPRDLTIARLGLAAMLVDARRNVEALAQIVLALKGQFAEVGMEGGIQALSLFQSGVAYKNMKFHARAEKALKSSLEISSRLLGEDHPYNAFAIFTLAGLYAELGRLDEAEGYYRRCLAICRTKAGMGYPRVAYLVEEFAPFLDRRGKRAEADALFAEMVEARRRRFAPDHPMIADALVLQGGFLFRRDPRRAESLLREALATYARRPSGRSFRLLDAHEYIAEVLFARGDDAEAEPHLRESLALIEGLPPTDFSDRAETKAWDLARLGAVRLRRGDLAEAEADLLESARLFRSEVRPANRPAGFFALESLALLRRRQGRPAEAAALTPERREACQGNPARLYDVARDLALCRPLMPPRDGGTVERPGLEDEVVDVLRQAALAGFRDARKLRLDPAFDPLRSRPDFRDYAADLGFPAKPFGR